MVELTEAEQLLLEWCRWWWDTPDVPTKMPDKLHVRSYVLLAKLGIDPLDIPNRVERLKKADVDEDIPAPPPNKRGSRHRRFGRVPTPDPGPEEGDGQSEDD